MSDKQSKNDDVDPELSDLLDSALKDFSKEPPKAPEEKKDEKPTEEVASALEQEWSTDYIKQAATQFESNIASLLGGEDDGSGLSSEQIQSSFQKMAEAAQQALLNPGITDPVSNDFASTISQTIQGLSQGASNIQTPFSDGDIMNMFNTSTNPDQNAFLPFMQGMMQSLLSKDVLYPSLKDILEKFPAWLAENEGKHPPEDIVRYKKQQDLMQNVCDELEGESEVDTADVRKQRFDRVLELMQKLQDYGQPPSDLVADVGPGVPFDQQGNPEGCSIM